jgi:hypothetical protein
MGRQLGYDFAQYAGTGQQLGRQGYRLVSVDMLYIGDPQTVLEPFSAQDAKALLTQAMYYLQAWLGRRVLGDGGHSSHICKGFLALGDLHFNAVGECHYTKRGTRLDALADHVQITHFKDTQRQRALREQHGT